MADTVTATGTPNDSKFEPCPEGSYAAVCVDVIDLGEKVERFENNPEKLVHKVVLVYQTAETNAAGEHYTVSKEFTLSMGDRAALRKHLEAWRGKPYTPDLIEEGVPLHRLVGTPAFIGVGNKVSAKGRAYAVLMSVMKMPNGMTLPPMKPYERPEFWAERKAEYAKAAAEFRARINAPKKDNGVADDSDLPF